MAIRVLDHITANQIAAGEVVERPASAVKELVENSLDAGASRIDVEIRSGGKELIRVTDNGSGMSAQDAELCVQRHATSKISTVDDLQRVLSFGFRGEALPSIAGVSKFELRTWDGVGDGGTSVIVEGGAVVSIAATGTPKGTSIWVRDLFYNTPARYKFMKTTPAESRAVLEILGFLALAHPEVALKLSIDGKEMLQTSGSGDLLETIGRVLGRDIARDLIPLDTGDGALRVTGFISSPHMVRASRISEVFFLNGRYIKNRMVASAVERAYERAIPAGRFPVAILALAVPPSSVDINVHPTKTEVKFEDDSVVFKLVHRAVTKAIATPGSLVGPANTDAEPSFSPAERGRGTAAIGHSRGGSNWGGLAATSAAHEGPNPGYGRGDGGHGTSPVQPPAPEAFRVLGQVLDTYVACADDRGLVLVDQHNSHERILYEEFRGSLLERRAGRPPQVQGLLVPIVLHPSPEEAAVLTEHLTTLLEMGFEVTLSGEDAQAEVEVKGLPVLFGGAAGSTDLEAVMAELASATDCGCEPQVLEERLMISLACKSAIKAGKKLDGREMASLVERLLRTHRPFTCPHGRPTFIRLAQDEIEKRLGRR